MKREILVIIVAAVSLTGCWQKEAKADAYGNFEADEIIVSSEVNGSILMLELNEGDFLEKGEFAAQIDSVQLHLNCVQMKAKLVVMDDQKASTAAQLQKALEDKKTIKIEEQRFINLVASNAVATQSLDKIQGNLRSLQQQIISLQAQFEGVKHEQDMVKIQLKMAQDQLKRTRVSNPQAGIILKKYMNAGELAVSGKPLYRIADISIMDLRCYVSGKQLSSLKLNQEVQVLIDNGQNGFYEYAGKISWISSKAEFTPKIIQTKEERVNLVYAVKIRVKNDGRIKIGMPAEVNF